jgi:hypothetical protein
MIWIHLVYFNCDSVTALIRQNFLLKCLRDSRVINALKTLPFVFQVSPRTARFLHVDFEVALVLICSN